MLFKRTTFPTEMKIGVHPEELYGCTEIGTFLFKEDSQIRKTNMFENAHLHRPNWRKRYFDALSCYRARYFDALSTRYKFIWRTGENSNHKL